jgi:hypothetical protein
MSPAVWEPACALSLGRVCGEFACCVDRGLPFKGLQCKLNAAYVMLRCRWSLSAQWMPRATLRSGCSA